MTGRTSVVEYLRASCVKTSRTLRILDRSLHRTTQFASFEDESRLSKCTSRSRAASHRYWPNKRSDACFPGARVGERTDVAYPNHAQYCSCSFALTLAKRR